MVATIYRVPMLVFLIVDKEINEGLVTVFTHLGTQKLVEMEF